MVYDYIKTHNLQDSNDKRIIHPDKNVQDLFHLDKGQTLEFKTFQTYMATLYKKVKESELNKSELNSEDSNVGVDSEKVKEPELPKKKAPRKKATQKKAKAKNTV